jgi:hypothetical protein
MNKKMKELFLISFFFLIINPLTTDEIKSSFKKDEYRTIKVVEYEGMRGILSESINSTVLRTKEHKKALWIEGNGYQMGINH